MLWRLSRTCLQIRTMTLDRLCDPHGQPAGKEQSWEWSLGLGRAP